MNETSTHRIQTYFVILVKNFSVFVTVSKSFFQDRFFLKKR